MYFRLVLVYFFLNFIENQVVQCNADLSEYVTVYDEGHEGAKLNVSITQCTNLSYYWKRRVSAIATHGLCARLFDGADCTGNSIEIMPTSPAHHNLGSWDFNNKAMALGPCRNECSVDITGSLPKATFQIKIYNQANYQGLNRTIDVQGCAVVPLMFLRQTGSIITYGYCVQLYSNPTCNPALGRNIELRRGTPFHNSLSEWEMTKANSASHCAYKCGNNSGTGLETGDVVLFDEHNLKGNFVKLNVREGNCLNVAADWEAAAISVQVSSGTCVTLFDQKNCLGDFLEVDKSVWNLRFVHFHTKARSMKSCGSYEVHATGQPTIDKSSVTAASTNLKSDKDEYKKATGGDGVGMSPLIIFVIVLLVLITLMIIIVRLSPGVRNSVNRYYGTLRNRLFEEDANEEFFSGFRWEADEPSGELGRNIVRPQATVSSEPNIDFESTGSGKYDPIYEDVVYKDTVYSI